MQKRKALGRGLDIMLGSAEVQPSGSSAINEISVEAISPNPEQPRRVFDEGSLEELATSIRELGIIQPLTLRAAGDGYQLIAGERRWRAAKLAGLKTVPAYVLTASDVEITEMALIENIQREDLNAIEVALAMRKLIDTYSLTQERLSERLGKSRTAIANHLRLLRLPAEIQLGLRDRKLDMGHARALLSVENPKAQLKLYNEIVKHGLSVRAVEDMARRINAGESPKAARPKALPAKEYEQFRAHLASYFPTPVKFTRSASGQGSITLKFDNDDQLQQLVALFEKLKR